MLGVMHVSQRENRRDDSEWDVDVEDPRPVVIVGDPAAERGTECRADHNADAKTRHAGACFLRRERLIQRRLRGREQRAAADSLDHAPENERQQGMRRAAEERGDRKKRDRSGEIALSAEIGGEPPRHRDDDNVGNDVGSRYPRDLVERRAEVPHHVRDGDVDDRGIDQLQHRRHCYRGGDDVFVRVLILDGARDRRRAQYGGTHRDVSTWTSTDKPGRSGRLPPHGLVTAILTGTRCTTLVKFPVALSGGSSANLAPVAPLTLSTLPSATQPPYASTENSTGCPG